MTDRDCVHGRLARSCEICELLAERDALRDDNDRLRQAIMGTLCEDKPCPRCDDLRAALQ